MEKIDWTRIDGHGLVILRTVVTSGSMAAASQALDINQSTISHTVDKLRKALKDPLFIRVGRGIEPTGYLMDLLPRIDVLLSDLSTLSKSGNWDPASGHVSISIAANVTEQLPQLLDLRGAFESRAKVDRLRFLELGSRERLVPLLETDDVDLAISVRPVKLPSVLESRPLFSNKFAVFYDPKKRNAPASLTEYLSAKHAVLDFGGKTPSTIDTILARMNAERRVTLGVSNVHALAAFLRGSDCISTMQKVLSGDAFAHLAHCDLPFAVPHVEFDLVWHRRNRTNPKNIWLRDVVSEVFGRS